MQAVYLLVVLAAVAAASPVPDVRVIPLLSRDETRDLSGAFTLEYKTGDGIILNERGTLIPSHDGKGQVLIKEGTYSYTAPDGTLVDLTYVADDKGFRPVGKHLPVSVRALPVSEISFV